MAKGYVIFDLAAMRMHGTTTLVPGTPLPRHDKRDLELRVSRVLLNSLAASETLSITGVRSAEVDPPDVLFELDGEEHGLEVTELLPDNRLERDAIIRQLRTRVISSLALGSATRDWVITITLTDDYASKFRVTRSSELVKAIVDFFAAVDSKRRAPSIIEIPPGLRNKIRRIHAEPWDLENDPRLARRDEPLIVFTAQHTNIVPHRDFPNLLRTTVGPKAVHDIGLPTWLLLWSHHYALGALKEQLVLFIDEFIQSMLDKYRRIFYLDLHHARDIVEFTRD